MSMKSGIYLLEPSLISTDFFVLEHLKIVEVLLCSEPLQLSKILAFHVHLFQSFPLCLVGVARLKVFKILDYFVTEREYQPALIIITLNPLGEQILPVLVLPPISTGGLVLAIPTDTVDKDDMVPVNLRVTHNLELPSSDTNCWNVCVSARISELILGQRNKNI